MWKKSPSEITSVTWKASFWIVTIDRGYPVTTIIHHAASYGSCHCWHCQTVTYAENSRGVGAYVGRLFQSWERTEVCKIIIFADAVRWSCNCMMLMEINGMLIDLIMDFGLPRTKMDQLSKNFPWNFTCNCRTHPMESWVTLDTLVRAYFGWNCQPLRLAQGIWGDYLKLCQGWLEACDRWLLYPTQLAFFFVRLAPKRARM